MYYRVRVPFYNPITAQKLFKPMTNKYSMPPRYVTNNKPIEFKYTIPVLASTNLSNFWVYYALQPKYERVFWTFINLTS